VEISTGRAWSIEVLPGGAYHKVEVCAVAQISTISTALTTAASASLRPESVSTSQSVPSIRSRETIEDDALSDEANEVSDGVVDTATIAVAAAAAWFHGNEYDRMLGSSDRSTRHRRARFTALSPLLEGNDGESACGLVRTFLGDAVDQRWPVFRTGKKPDSCLTVMTWVIDIDSGQLLVWAGANPSPEQAQDPLLTFDLANPQKPL